MIHLDSKQITICDLIKKSSMKLELIDETFFYGLDPKYFFVLEQLYRSHLHYQWDLANHR